MLECGERLREEDKLKVPVHHGHGLNPTRPKAWRPASGMLGCCSNHYSLGRWQGEMVTFFCVGTRSAWRIWAFHLPHNPCHILDTAPHGTWRRVASGGKIISGIKPSRSRELDGGGVGVGA